MEQSWTAVADESPRHTARGDTDGVATQAAAAARCAGLDVHPTTEEGLAQVVQPSAGEWARRDERAMAMRSMPGMAPQSH
eukprot:10186916-Alexandrium_andersonii.AAC.1